MTSACLAVGKPDEAINLWERLRDCQQAKLGPEDPETLMAAHRAANAYESAGRLSHSLLMREEILAMARASFGPAHRKTLTFSQSLAMAYQRAGQLPRALKVMEETLDLVKANSGQDPNADPKATLSISLWLALAYSDANRVDEAIALYDPFFGNEQKEMGNPNIESLEEATRASVCATYARLMLLKQNYQEAERTARAALELREQMPDFWGTHYSRSLLGGALAGLHKYAEAEPLLVAGYEGMTERKKGFPAREKFKLTESLQRLIDLYEAWGKPNEAAKWRMLVPPPADKSLNPAAPVQDRDANVDKSNSPDR